MNNRVLSNYNRLNSKIFACPLCLLLVIAFLFYFFDINNANKYAQVQRDTFLFLNLNLGYYFNTQINLTQIGDALVFLSFLSVFMIYAPKIWESTIFALLVSFVLTFIPKKIFAIPRPAALYDHEHFIIIGEKLSGHNSFPSGHSITVFTIMTVLIFSLMPSKLGHKILWFILMLTVGLLFCSTRIGVGAHYPLDVLVGGIIGYLSGLAGIFIVRKYPLCAWVGNMRYCPVFISLFLICAGVLVYKIFIENLPIFYLAFASLAFSIYKLSCQYAKK